MKNKRKNDLFVQFGQAVRKYRTTQGWSQEKLAEKAGLHRTYVADIERGVRNGSLRNLDKMAKALEITLCSLLAGISGGGRK